MGGICRLRGDTALRIMPVMLTLFKRLLGRSPKADAPSALVLSSDVSARAGGLDLYQGDGEAGDFAITRYPPFDAGIPVIGVE